MDTHCPQVDSKGLFFLSVFPMYNFESFKVFVFFFFLKKKPLCISREIWTLKTIETVAMGVKRVSIYLSVCPFVSPARKPASQPASVFPSVRLSAQPPIYLSIYPWRRLPIHLTLVNTTLSGRGGVCLFVFVICTAHKYCICHIDRGYIWKCKLDGKEQTVVGINVIIRSRLVGLYDMGMSHTFCRSPMELGSPMELDSARRNCGGLFSKTRNRRQVLRGHRDTDENYPKTGL